ncbi:MAG: DUF1080 domain-containing protein, partial [Luteolibacter sp.]
MSKFIPSLFRLPPVVIDITLWSLVFLQTAALAEPQIAEGGEGDGYELIFDGTLKGWDGDPAYWRADNGILVGEVTPATLLKNNTFLIWRGGDLGDFELKLEYCVSANGNSGINYRSSDFPGVKWGMRGYQADTD